MSHTQPSPSRSQTPANGIPSGEPSEHSNTPISAHQDPLSVPPPPSLYTASSVPSEAYPFPFFPGPAFSPRAVSPAHSIASAITSLTEGTSVRSEVERPFFKYPTGDALQKLIGKPRKQRLFNHQRKEICLYHQENPGIRQEDIANKWGVERSTVSKILKQKSVLPCPVPQLLYSKHISAHSGRQNSPRLSPSSPNGYTSAATRRCSLLTP
ncbi:hypothetical protein EDB85DRAFT_528032 [Lactarius pseudohatsudake]|nr:hypothetical protein EDB85DRAFT_528032 [Lactarius pseudohatsudake]